MSDPPVVPAKPTVPPSHDVYRDDQPYKKAEPLLADCLLKRQVALGVIQINNKRNCYQQRIIMSDFF